MQIILASNNKGKQKELQQILKYTSFTLHTLSKYPQIPDPPETQDTFQGNALQKARFVYQHTKNIVIADDSGLCVDALNGGPGVFSKRYTPEARTESNNRKLLQELTGIENRKAHFHCSIAIVCANGEKVLDGDCHGKIATSPKGTGGFGYDPLFIPDAFPDRHMAELSSEEKNSISHRGKALKGLTAALIELNLN